MKTMLSRIAVLLSAVVAALGLAVLAAAAAPPNVEPLSICAVRGDYRGVELDMNNRAQAYLKIDFSPGFDCDQDEGQVLVTRWAQISSYTYPVKTTDYRYRVSSQGGVIEILNAHGKVVMGGWASNFVPQPTGETRGIVATLVTLAGYPSPLPPRGAGGARPVFAATLGRYQSHEIE